MRVPESWLRQWVPTDASAEQMADALTMAGLEVESLEAYRPNVVTEVYGDGGQIIGSFALERRIIVSPSQIPQVLKDAVVSVEDQNFYQHWGLDFSGISRAALKNVLAGRVVEGGSTITQQLAENLFLSPQRRWALKLQEALLSIQIERRYTKDEILALYTNQIYLGHGMYGFAAASEFYFGKNIQHLTLEEAAILAALPRAPSSYSPIDNPERALMRRNYVIDRMVAESRISVDEGEQAKQRPIRLNPTRNPDSIAPYFIEELRQYLESTYGTYAVHEGGLRVYSTLNARMQRAAQASLTQGLREYDKRHGWRGATLNLIENGLEDLDSHLLPEWKRPLRDGAIVPGIVLEVDGTTAAVRVGDYHAAVVGTDIAWTGQSSPERVFDRGDVALFRIESIDSAAKTAHLSLEQKPEVQGALLAIDPGTGEVKALVGGYDFAESKFNRATQAERQTGSAFKPVLYTAALDQGMRPDHMIEDVPVDFDGYAPSNYDGKYLGSISLREAFAQSRNVPAVRILAEMGFDPLVRMVSRFGILSPIEPYLPVALGATDMTLMELTSAYSTFPNGGVRIEPRMINRVVDYDGNLLEEDLPRPRDVISAALAAQMVDLLGEVVRSGTAQRAKSLNRPVAGKTGTTNDFTDAWFMGFTPSLVAGVWVGFDAKVSLGSGETGSRAALPIWTSFIEQVYEDTPVETFDPAEGKLDPVSAVGSPALVESAGLPERRQP